MLFTKDHIYSEKETVFPNVRRVAQCTRWCNVNLVPPKWVLDVETTQPLGKCRVDHDVGCGEPLRFWRKLGSCRQWLSKKDAWTSAYEVCTVPG